MYSDTDFRAVLTIAAGDGGINALSRRLGRDGRLVRGWIADPPRSRPGRGAWEQLLDEAATEMVRRLRTIEAAGGRVGSIVLAIYDDDAAIQRLTGDGWTAATHTELMRRTARLAAAAGITATLGRVDEAGYRAWLGERESSAALRAAYAAEHPEG